MIIFYKVEVRTMKLVESTLEKYEIQSKKKINKKKSAIYLHYNVAQG